MPKTIPPIPPKNPRANGKGRDLTKEEVRERIKPIREKFIRKIEEEEKKDKPK